MKIPGPLAHLDLGEVVDEEPYRHSIWVEAEYLEFERNE